MKLLNFLFILSFLLLANSCSQPDSPLPLNLNGSFSGFAKDLVHPLDGLNEEEIKSVVEILKSNNKYKEEGTLVSDIVLIEPDKSAVYNWKIGDPINRKAQVIFRDGTKTFKGIIDLAKDSIESWTMLADMQPLILLDEFMKAVEVWKSDKRVTDVLTKRDHKIGEDIVVPLTPG